MPTNKTLKIPDISISARSTLLTNSLRILPEKLMNTPELNTTSENWKERWRIWKIGSRKKLKTNRVRLNK